MGFIIGMLGENKSLQFTLAERALSKFAGRYKVIPVLTTAIPPPIYFKCVSEGRLNELSGQNKLVYNGWLGGNRVGLEATILRQILDTKGMRGILFLVPGLIESVQNFILHSYPPHHLNSFRVVRIGLSDLRDDGSF